jgi:hypothetical protein
MFLNKQKRERERERERKEDEEKLFPHFPLPKHGGP